MRNFFLSMLLLVSAVSTQAQIQGQCVQQISLYNDYCNSSWLYDDFKFYRIILEGMMSGELKPYSFEYDNPMPTSVADVYDQYRQAKAQEFEFEGLYDEPVMISTRWDSVQALRPIRFEIQCSYDGNADTIRLKKEWFRIVSLVEPEFGYVLSYAELVAFLDQKKNYWVNPYQAGDSVLFSTALQQERYIFEWRGEISDVKFYSTELYSNKVVSAEGYTFKGNLIRYANIRDKANRPYSNKRPQGTVVSVLMSAYLSGKIKGYDPYSGVQPILFTADSYRSRVLDVTGSEYFDGEEAVSEIPYSHYSDNLDVISVSYHTTIDDIQKLFKPVTEEPYLFTIAISPENNYKGMLIPFISFNYAEAMSVLEATGLMWYAYDNHADSCSIAVAIQRNNVYWNVASLTDLKGTVIYRCMYDKDSSRMRLEEERPSPCLQKVIDHTIKGIEVKMNTQCANTNIPARSLPLYLHYWGTRSLDKTEDSTLTFLKDLSSYIVNKALEGKITMYKTDSLNLKLSKEEFVNRMIVSGYVYDAEGNETEARDTLDPDDFYVTSVQSDFIVNGKGKLTLKDRSVQLRVPVDFSVKGIEMSLASFSYSELSTLMKKDKQGKALLKQLDATRKQGMYKLLLDAYGYELYDFWGWKSKEEQLKNVYPAIQPYLQK